MKKIPVLDQCRAKIVSALQAEVCRIEGVRHVKDVSPLSSGCPPLNRLLPEKGFPRGALIEWLTRDGGGAGVLAMIAAREAAREGGAVVGFMLVQSGSPLVFNWILLREWVISS